MRILTRYILSEVISHAAIGIAVFTFVLFTRDLGHILDLVVRNSAPLPSVLRLLPRVPWSRTVPRSSHRTKSLQLSTLNTLGQQWVCTGTMSPGGIRVSRTRTRSFSRRSV